MGAKLKNRLFSSSMLLPLGPNHVASPTPLFDLVNTVDKFTHALTLSDLRSDDIKQNYRVVEKLCDERVTACLKSICDSRGTIAYIEIMRSSTRPFLQSMDLSEAILFTDKW